MRALGILAALVLAGSVGGSALGAAERERPLPPIASLSDGVWMKGDLHIHSRHSKDSSNNPVKKIIALAETVGMDYLLISDHDNPVLGDVAHHTWADPEYVSKSMVLLYGAEWTTHRGHATTIAAKPYDHQAFYDVRDQRDVVIGAEKKKLGLHLSANHPGTTDAFAFSYDIVDSIEVWNSAIWSRNAISMHIWDGTLKSGRKLTGRGGSDSHHGYPDTPAEATSLSYQAPENNVGTPTTWVFARARTGQAVVDALTNGRVSVSANPFAPRVEFYADLNGDGRMDMMQGDNARPTGKPVTFRVQLAGKSVIPDAAYTVHVVKDGQKFATLSMSGAQPIVDFTDTPAPGVRSYYRVEVEGPPTAYPQVPGSMKLSGTMLGLSNPICFNFDPNF